ncbi:pilus (MSHA type) biogenesis protein MshL [Ferriphaselus sp. R-1]|uniref:pilus (MSHA type) biogenesis protein MshL n=1 Tax=Ferriphaselus sp. R-1 TaxID=1485544 RepID=UPI00068E7604|nr:pilus (MSHA type) biogenesis protein MshL [Ferriphaselus sp. R-1]
MSHTHPHMIFIGLLCLVSCGTAPITPSARHLLRDSPAANTAVTGDIPALVTDALPLPSPRPSRKPETYSVVVTQVPAQEILFALARDARINLDIHPGIIGSVTMNALDQTLPQLLDRIARQVDMRYELHGNSLIVLPDSPYLHHYKIDYVNMSRDADTAIANATQVSSSVAPATTGTPTLPNNNSLISIRNSSHNHFWETLTQNIKDLLHETDKILPEGSSETVVEQKSAISTTGTGAAPPPAAKKGSAKPTGLEASPNPASLQEGGTTITRRSTFREAASVIANPETGLLTVRATRKQHEKVQEFVDRVMNSARRQVLIEATVVEVRLSDQYRQGINWSLLQQGGALQLRQAGGAGLPTAGNGSLFILDYLNPTSRLGNLGVQVSLLESFGNVKVLSSPKLSVLNNQTAMLRVVDNLVYFTVKADTTTNQTNSITTYTTTPNTLPIGFTMSVTPQIDESDTVLLNLKPSISRVIGYVNDPNPELARVGITSRIPQTQTREMESVLKIDSRQIAVLGGLMQDQTNKLTDAVPGLSRLPGLGRFFTHTSDSSEKTELVIFLRPQVVRNASLNGDYLAFGHELPDTDFFSPDLSPSTPVKP